MPRIDSFSILSRRTSSEDPSVDIVETIDWKKQAQIRGGIIMVKRVTSKEGNEEIYFGFGIDRNFGDITDFGGSVKAKDRSRIFVCLREFAEETCGIFGFLSFENIAKYPCVSTSRVYIVFLEVNDSFERIDSAFSSRSSKIPNPEILKIVWKKKDEILFDLSHDRFYLPISPLLFSSIDKIEEMFLSDCLPPSVTCPKVLSNI
jgi:hypothetical protein